MRFLASAAFIAALAGVTPAMAACNQLVCRAPAVHVNTNGVESQAQLANQLRQEGYSEIHMSPYAPTAINPRPELMTPTSAPAQTPVHNGWNGTASKDGSVVDIYAN